MVGKGVKSKPKCDMHSPFLGTLSCIPPWNHPLQTVWRSRGIVLPVTRGCQLHNQHRLPYLCSIHLHSINLLTQDSHHTEVVEAVLFVRKQVLFSVFHAYSDKGRRGQMPFDWALASYLIAWLVMRS